MERDLAQKGFKEVSDPDAADFLVDFCHIAVRRRNTVTVERVYPGAYPGLVCGPFGCYSGWGYGPAAVGYENIRFREGTIVIDAEQNPSNSLDLSRRRREASPPRHVLFLTGGSKRAGASPAQRLQAL